MAAIKFLKFPTLVEATLLMDGGIRLPRNFKPDDVIMGLHGLTLVFTAPSATVTFADANAVGLTLKAIMAEIASDSSNALKAQLFSGSLFIIQPTPSAAVALDLSASTAKASFGFKSDATGSYAGKKYDVPSGTAPRVLSFQPAPQADSIIVMTEE